MIDAELATKATDGEIEDINETAFSRAMGAMGSVSICGNQGASRKSALIALFSSVFQCPDL